MVNAIVDDDRYSFKQAATLIHESVKPQSLKRAAYNGKLEVVRIGATTLVTGAALKRYMQEQTKPCRGQTLVRDSSSLAPTESTELHPKKASLSTSGTSSGQSEAATKSGAQARALSVANKLKANSVTSSTAERSNGMGLVVPIR